MANEVNNEGVKTPEERLSDLLAEIMKIQRSAKESSDVTELYKEIDRISEELKSVVEASSVKENTAMIDAVNGFLFSESYKALDHAWTLISEGLGNLYSDDEIREYLAGLEDVDVLKKQYILSSLDKNFSDANSCMLAYNVKKCNEMLQSGKIDDFVNRQADQGDIIKKCMESGVSRNQIAEILKNPDVTLNVQSVDDSLSEKGVIQSDSPSEKTPIEFESQEPVMENNAEPAKPIASQMAPITDKALENLAKPSSDKNDIDSQSKKTKDSELESLKDVKWDDIRNLSMGGVQQYFCERQFDNSYTIKKCVEGGVGHFIEYGKTPNGDIILLPSPSFYTGKKPLLDTGVGVFSLLFGKDGYDEYQQLDTIHPAVIKPLNGKKVSIKDALVAMGSAKTVSKEKTPMANDISEQLVIGPSKPVDPLYEPTPISWDEICKMNFEGKTQYYATRTIDNKYPIRKVKTKEDGIGQFVEYGKTPNGQIILIPNPKYYSDIQPILDKGVTVWSLFFDYYNKYAYGNTMEIVPAVICDFNDATILPNDVLISRGRAQTIKKKDNIINSGASAENVEPVKAETVLYEDDSSKDPQPDNRMSHLLLPDEDYINSFVEESRKRALHLLGYDTVTYENRYFVDSVANKIDFGFQIVQEQDVYEKFVSEFPEDEDYLETDFENSIRSVLLNQNKDVTPENITNDVIMDAVKYYSDMISQKLDEKKGLENEHSQDDEKSPGNWRGYEFEIPMESIERTELSGEPEDPLYGYRQIAMCVLGYTKADRNNISEILDMELELFKKREADSGEYGVEVDESSYDDAFDDIYDYYQKADGYLARAVGIVKKIKRSASEVEYSRSERALKKKEEKMQKTAAKEMQKKEREKIKQAKAEEVKKLRALQQEALEQKKAALQRVAQQQDDIARRIHPELFNPSSPDTFVMPDEYKDKKSKR